MSSAMSPQVTTAGQITPIRAEIPPTHRGRLVSWLASPTTLRRVALASIVANVTIVVTGGAVRLTGSGLGCPTWPRCTADSYIPTDGLGGHAVIEFGNRLLTPVLGLIALLGVVCALLVTPRRRRVTHAAVAVLAVVAAQGLLGGLTVWTTLDPGVVGAHFLLSMVAIAAAYAFWVAARDSANTDSAARAVNRAVPRPLRTLAAITVATSAAVLVVGTLVTGSGPHAGDATARRNGLNPEIITQVHADLVFVLVGLSVALLFALRAVGAHAAAVRAGWLVAAELAQGVIGIVQHATGLPPLLVGLHLAGACAVWLATLSLRPPSLSRRS